jgi:peptide/nickel transport system substrate-binding protein
MGDGLFAGRYELAELLGSGGMARVHRARDTRMGRVVAIKTLMPELAGDPDARRRFAREAHAAGALNHPGIVTVHDQDEYQDGENVVPYLVMEYVRGGTLAQLVREQAPFEPERAVRIVCDMLDALAHAHAHGTVHRDVKPANVMITTEGAVKVADFGIARVLDIDTRLTAAGSSIGTPSYMSPEQINGGDVDARSDIYAVGCVLTELLTGKPPFHEGTPIGLMYWHVHADPPAPSSRNPRIPAELDTLVLAALAKAPADRPADAGVYRARLWAWLTAARSSTLTGPAASPPRNAAPHPPSADPRATYGVAGALPSIPAQGTPPPSPTPQNPLFQSPAPQNPAARNPAFRSPAPPHLPNPQQPPAPQPVEHPAYSRSPQVPLPPPYQPSTPPPVNIASPQDRSAVMSGPLMPGPPMSGPAMPGPVLPPSAPKSRWTGRRKILTGVAGVAVAGVTVSVVLATGALGGDKPTPRPPVPTRSVLPNSQQAALKRHGGAVGVGYNGGVNGVVRPSTKAGGTVNLAASYLDTSLLDPADTYDPSAWNVQRLLYRNLVSYAPAPGDKGRKVVPDLATSTGKVSGDGLTWTYKLKSGVRFQDGSAITSKDIKYGIERTFDRDVHAGGATYLSDILDEGQHYPGPYKDSDPDKMGLKSVDTPDDGTIVFTLDRPYTDFPYILAMSIGAAVPPSADTDGGKAYEKAPVASGPYKVSSYVPGKSLHLVRNPQWNATTDPVRSQLPAAYDLKLYDSQPAVEAALLDGAADLDFSETLLGDDTESKVINDPSQKADVDLSYSGAVRYLSLQTSVAPFDKAACRQAVEYAVDRPSVQAALGGEYEGGDIAPTMLPPTNNSHDFGADPYTDDQGRPQTDLAHSKLAACGKAGGFSTTLVGIKNASRGEGAMLAVANALKKVGINVTVKSMDATSFYDVLLSPTKLKAANWGMVYTAWIGDYPTGGGFLRELVEPGGSGNYSALDDSTLNGMVDDANQLTDESAASRAWTKIDAKLMKDATMVPLVYDRHLVYRGQRLTNVYQQQVLGEVDLTALGLK